MIVLLDEVVDDIIYRDYINPHISDLHNAKYLVYASARLNEILGYLPEVRSKLRKKLDRGIRQNKDRPPLEEELITVPDELVKLRERKNNEMGPGTTRGTW
jgi:hypothetical protein